MKIRNLCALAALTVLTAVPTIADDFDNLLVPIAPQRIHGAFGSEWVADLAVTNMGTTPVRVARDAPDVCSQCVPLPLPPGATAFVHDLSRVPGVTGTLLWVERGRAQDIAVTLRTRDVSRQAETWGTVIPVVRPEGLFSRRFGLVDVPMEPQFRATLRIYDVNAITQPRVRVRIYELNPERNPGSGGDADTLLHEFEPAFVLPEPGMAQLVPAAAEVPLWLEAALPKSGRIRIEIEPFDGTAEYWAFVSVTHNSTQHVTVIAPE